MTKDKRRSLYEFDWQLLRVKLSFRDMKDFTTSIYALENYLTAHNRRPRALYKVINLMAAVSMGLHSSKQIGKDPRLLQSVQQYREKLSTEYQGKEKEEDWSIDNDTRKMELQYQVLQDIHIVKQDLTLRWIKHEKGPAKYKKTRPELEEYIYLLEEELVRRAHKASGN